jgi:YesN/AraC family two-component response regulator
MIRGKVIMMDILIQSGTNEIMYDVVDFIDTHYDEPINLNLLSEQFYISTYYLSRTFKKVIGCSLNEYLNEVRIDAAKEYLANSDHSITRISELCGYDSLTHFGRMFKRKSGKSPREFKGSIAV